MSVELEPAELGFKRPFTHEVSQVLRLRNPNNDSVAFKVKTTAPKQYCVRPNSGRIEAGADVEVQVLLQAMKEDPPPDTKCRDKFLVQSVAIKADTDANVTQIWTNIEQNAKSSIQEKKIRVNFLPADSDSGATTTTGAGASAGHDSSAAALPAAAAAGGAASAAAATVATTNGVSSEKDTASDSPPSYSSPTPPATTPQRQSAQSPDSTSSTTQSSLETQLAEAKATIARLQAQAQEAVRQRKPQEAAEKAVNAVQESLHNAPAPGGVPIQIVALLCLVCFLIAWIFF